MTTAQKFPELSGMLISIAASQCYQESKIASLQIKVLRLTEANKGLKEEKKTLKASGSSSSASLSQAPHLAPYCLSSLLPMDRWTDPTSGTIFLLLFCAPYASSIPQVPRTNSLTELPLYSETLPNPFFL